MFQTLFKEKSVYEYFEQQEKEMKTRGREVVRDSMAGRESV